MAVNLQNIHHGWRLCSSESDWQGVRNLIEFYTTKQPPNVTELETLLKCPPKKQTLVKLLIINSSAVGLYIVRLKGIQEEGGPPLQMPLLDGVFIKKEFRLLGWGTRMLQDVVNNFPDQDIGFSQPISNSLSIVVKKFLSANPQYRDRFWSVENDGGEGDRLNLWFNLASNKRL